MTLQKPQNLRIDLPLEKIGELCRRLGVEELSIFGSALREDFRPDSDIDLLVKFHNNDLGPWMGKLTDLENELSALLGRRVDLVPRDAIKWVIRDRVLSEAETVYADR